MQDNGEPQPQPSDSLNEHRAARRRLFDNFSLDNFELVEPVKDIPYVKVTLPEPVTKGKNPFTEEIEGSRFMQKFPGGIPEAATHLDQSIRDYASTHNLPEVEEIAIRNDPVIAEAIDEGFQHQGEVLTPSQEYDRQRMWMQIFFTDALNTAFRKVKPTTADTPEFHAWMRNPDAWVTQQKVDRIRTLIGDPFKPETGRFVVINSKKDELFKTPQALNTKTDSSK